MLLIAIFCKSPTSNRAVFVEFQITIQFSINIRYYYHCSMCECAMCSGLMSVTDWDPAPAMRAPAPGPGHLVTGRQSPDTPRPRVPCPALETSEIIQCIQCKEETFNRNEASTWQTIFMIQSSEDCRFQDQRLRAGLRIQSQDLDFQQVLITSGWSSESQ